MICPDCLKPMRLWKSPGQSAEVYVCDTTGCEVTSITVKRQGVY